MSPKLTRNYAYKMYSLLGFVLNHTVNWGDPALTGANNKVDVAKWEGDLAAPWDECKIVQICWEENTAYVWRYNMKDTIQIYIKEMLKKKRKIITPKI